MHNSLNMKNMYICICGEYMCIYIYKEKERDVLNIKTFAKHIYIERERYEERCAEYRYICAAYLFANCYVA